MATAALPLEADREHQLRLLVRSQAADAKADRRRRLPNRGKVVRECDLAGDDPNGFRLDRIEDPAAFEPFSRPRRGRKVKVKDFEHFVGLDDPWEAAIHDAVRAGLVVCPGCQEQELPFLGVCLVCHRSGLDDGVAAGRLELPGYDVGELINPGFEPDPKPTKYRPGRLRGGIGKAARARQATG